MYDYFFVRVPKENLVKTIKEESLTLMKKTLPILKSFGKSIVMMKPHLIVSCKELNTTLLWFLLLKEVMLSEEPSLLRQISQLSSCSYWKKEQVWSNKYSVMNGTATMLVDAEILARMMSIQHTASELDRLIHKSS